MERWTHEKGCPVCGKRFCIRDLELWVYKEKHKNYSTFYCSWKCLEEKRRKRA